MIIIVARKIKAGKLRDYLRIDDTIVSIALSTCALQAICTRWNSSLHELVLITPFHSFKIPDIVRNNTRGNNKILSTIAHTKKREMGDGPQLFMADLSSRSFCTL